MMHIRSRLPLIAAAALVALSVPRDADAQFLKKVKDAAKKQAAEAVGLEKKSDSTATSTDAASPAATPASSSAKTSSSSSSSRRSSGQITITAEVLDAFVGAFDEELAWQKEQARIRASHVAFEESVKKYDTCKANAMTKPENMEGANQAAADRYMAIGERLANEALKLTQTNDTLRIRIVTDSAQLVSDLAMREMIPGIKKCGTRPTTPPAEKAHEGSRRTIVGEQVRQKFGRSEFGVLRERVAAYVLTDGKFGAGYKSEYMAYGEAELAALAAAMPKLKALEPHFRDGTLGWTSWYDLGKW